MTWLRARIGVDDRPVRRAVPARAILGVAAVLAWTAACSSSSGADERGSGTEGGSTDLSSAAAAIPDPPATTVAELLALGRPVVLAHGAGENAHPAETLYSYVTSAREGVDVLDMDVWHSADGQVVIIHDSTVDRTTDGSGAVVDMTADELRALDAAYDFSPSCESDDVDVEHPWRGVRTGEKPPPEGFTPDDFGVAMLSDVLDRFEGWVLNIEVKGDGEVARRTAELTVEELRAAGRMDAAVVTSFDDEVVDHLGEIAPELELTPGLDASARFVLADEPPPEGRRILQLPVAYEGIDLLTDGFLQRTQQADLPVWVWPNDAAYENTDEYRRFFDRGLDGVNANCPAEAVAALGTYLTEGS